MTHRFPTCSAEDNHLWSLGCFVQLLLEQRPESVLDVGCGAGRLMKLVRERDVTVHGIDQAGPRLDALIDEGLDAREGSAYALPFDDGSVDWVTLRHVPHHLERPSEAIAEALRVCSTGVLVAEPAYDLSVPSQHTARALDSWEKRQDRRGGMFHAEVHELDALLEMCPDQRALTVESRRFLRLRERSIADFAVSAEARLEGLPPDHEERAALSRLLSDCERDGLSWNGSLCVVFRRRS